ncbi:host cell division inhibitor Icd-like protein [Gilliamella sp. Pas-s95]|uniref:host cell division inhibitor Icd-like protein n=1 Tax=Gilliamella sp. Pas-s95 TaxID=2687317 RepID=UPI0013269AF5|nr:host cell division inhibitor Icd-like protein [Gilliamella sp. Pas-s95]
MGNYLKKAMPRSAVTLSRHLTTITLTEVMIMANRYDSAHLCARQSKPSKSSKKHLHNLNHSGYIDSALAKSKVRIGTLNSYLATHDAQSVFFCVNACAHLFINISSMVALVGHPKGWLGHQVTSSSNPANVTANEIGTSSGDYVNHYLEAVTMTTIPTPIISTQKLYKFYDLSTAQVVQTTATTERQARKSLGKSSLIFIARIRLYPVIEDTRSFGGYSHE